MDGTGLCSSRKELDGKSLYKVYNKGTEEKYTEYLYYVLEAKLILRENVVVSIMTEFVDNEGKELEKQDCELTAAKRLMKRLKEEFPMLSSVFYISSMRESSEEFNSDKVIQNIGYLCNEELEELPYWETINNYLKRINPDELQNIIIELVKRLIRSRAFEEG